MIPILNLFSSERPRTMMVEIIASDRDFPMAHVHHVFAVNGIVFEPREVSQGDEATVRYLTTLQADRLARGPQRAVDGRRQDGHQECLLVAAEARVRPRAAGGAARDRDPRAGRAPDRLLRVIGGARRRLVLSLFRCDDFAVLDALAGALERGCDVEAILTKRAKGGKKRLQKLWEALEEMGAVVSWFADPVVKYHAKYLVADDGRRRW